MKVGDLLSIKQNTHTLLFQHFGKFVIINKIKFFKNVKYVKFFSIKQNCFEIYWWPEEYFEKI